MPEFDPRRPPLRLAPRLLVLATGFSALALAWQMTAAEPAPAAPERQPLDAAAVAALQHQAFAQAEAQPGFARPQSVRVKVLPGETFEAAVRRVGVGSDEARQAVQALDGAFDTVNIKAGLAFDAAVARPRDRRGPARLIGLSMRTGPATAITLARTFDGALRLREMEEEILDDVAVAQGEMNGSLYASAARVGATSDVTAQVVKLFSHKLDFSRDIKAGDKFSLVFDRKVTESGRTVESGDLLFAEVEANGGTTRFYRFQAPGMSQPQYFDDSGKNIRGFLLRTPLDGARVTSGFGARFHPILGYNRMHAGVDFGAGIGTPVYAAGDGVVAEARWAGGYGRWLKIRHNGKFETGYAHLSGFAVKPGQRVRQGQVVAYVGNTGRSTGPHLHYEVMLNGQKVNPKGAKVPQGTILEGRDLVAFKAEKARIDGILAKASGGRTPATQVAALRTLPGAAPISLR
jgi:murein DD-endopeptidase MepM/ murein hydrolase activator NlpD